jgi:hypothetical protein
MKAIFAIAIVLTSTLLTACFSDTRFTIPKFAVSGKPICGDRDFLSCSW